MEKWEDWTWGCFVSGKDLLPTDVQHSDPYLLFAAHLLVDLWQRTGMSAVGAFVPFGVSLRTYLLLWVCVILGGYFFFFFKYFLFGVDKSDRRVGDSNMPWPEMLLNKGSFEKTNSSTIYVCACMYLCLDYFWRFDRAYIYMYWILILLWIDLEGLVSKYFRSAGMKCSVNTEMCILLTVGICFVWPIMCTVQPVFLQVRSSTCGRQWFS